MPRLVYVLLAAAALLLSGCDLPFGIGTPTTRALEAGAAQSLDGAASFEISGFYTQTQGAPPIPAVSGSRVSPPAVGSRWQIDLQVTRAGAERYKLANPAVTVEAIVLGPLSYFRGQTFLQQYLGGDPSSADLVKAAGNAWWKGPSGLVPQLPDLTGGAAFRSTFLGSAVTSRTDHVTIDGAAAVELSGPRADVYIASSAPYRVLRLVIHRRVTIDGIGESDLRYFNYGKDFAISAPANVIDFSNLSTLPPIYTVVSVDTTRCASPCVVSAALKNLGGPMGARAPSTVTFTLKDSATGAVGGSCQTTVAPDVGYAGTTTVSCTIPLGASPPSAAIVTATVDNPGRG